MPTNPPTGLMDLSPEIILQIFAYLDLPDLATLAQISPVLADLASDDVLHKHRLRVVAPSRVDHSLFGQSPQGVALRPTVGDLVHRGVMRGLGIGRRWRMGAYFYSHNSVVQYETSLRLERRYARSVVSSYLRRRILGPNSLRSLHQAHVLPDVESSSLSVSRTLLPVMHQLKWSFQKDQLAKTFRNGASDTSSTVGRRGGILEFGKWFEKKGRAIVEDGERVRLAICPSVRKVVGFYEDLRQ